MSTVTIMYSAGIVYPVTPCCGTDATGTQNGTACRGCYREIDPVYGQFAAPHRAIAAITEWIRALDPQESDPESEARAWWLAHLVDYAGGLGMPLDPGDFEWSPVDEWTLDGMPARDWIDTMTG